MCGRFTLRTPPAKLVEHFGLDALSAQQLPLFGPRYNVAPTQEILTVRLDSQSNRREFVVQRWGLIPSWSDPKTGGAPMINARAETLAERPMFSQAFRHRRCLIPADGFYEWRALPHSGRGKKQPYYIRRPDDAPFAFAGLWETWTDPAGTPAVESCAIITTEASTSLRDLHERMPVIVAPGNYEVWLNTSVANVNQLNEVLLSCHDVDLVADPVSTHVNRVANDDPRCIAPERTLF